MAIVKKNKPAKTRQKKSAYIQSTPPHQDDRVSKKLIEINKMLEKAVFLPS